MDPVLSDLARSLEVDSELELLNFYKSYPITIHSSLVRLDPTGVLYLRVSSPESVSLFQNKTTTLLTNYLAHAIQAKILRFDIVEGLAVLGGFSYLDSRTGRRMVVRVQPGEPIPVELERADLIIRGLTADISLVGMGVVVANPIVKRDEIFNVRVGLPEGEISLVGTIVNVIQGNGTNRLSIKFLANSRKIALLMDYITQRQLEIRDDLQRLYNRVYQTARA